MNPISDIRIVGIDEENPPRVRKEAYIDLFFKLSQKTPLDWCEDFNALGHKIEPGAKVKKDKGMIIETWVRDMDLIPAHLEKIKKTIIHCNQQYLEKIRLKEQAAASKGAVLLGKDREQVRLNDIVAALNFDKQ